ncbi:hypothetical protein SAMN04244560_00853 [Thermoanaerobacter thermohydrosulfuricus]|uniref:Uncharacterized protein n=1 Tax=Thermoanaerobacter thermohydrosulfuricus TaxID=1516 RepID=A0A1G7LRH8_THETY|nr:hypothetical protein [Thermoanaerobacter thermohydrosulfuricus]SDF51954.1 hypothetical protein SAMN04244560_00853 [Thermoanaerobacter thermohydrosulfuricus]
MYKITIYMPVETEKEIFNNIDEIKKSFDITEKITDNLYKSFTGEIIEVEKE